MVSTVVGLKQLLQIFSGGRMKQNISRRDFLKIAGVGLGALAFNPFKPSEYPLSLPQFPVGDRLGRVFSRIDVRSEPNFNAPSVGVLYDDYVVV